MRKLILTLAALLTVVSLRAQMPDTVMVSRAAGSVALENSLLDAVSLYDSAEIEKAAEAFRRISVADSTCDAAFFYLGMCECSAGNYGKAEGNLVRAVKLDSSNYWYRNVLANLYVESGRPDKAAPLLEKLVEESPASYNNPYTLTIIADSHLAQYMDSSALSYYDRALELDPSYAPAEMGKAELFRLKGNNPGFFNSLGKVVKNEGVNAEAKSKYLQAIMDHMDAKTWWVWGEEICRLIDTCLELHPEDIGSRWLKVSTDAIRDDWDGVMDQCLIIAQLAAKAGDGENFVKAYSSLGDIYHEQKHDERKCFAMYDIALKADPGYVPVLNNYAYYLCSKGKQLRKALKMSAVTIEKEPDNATYLDTYAWILHLLGKDDEAKPYFKHALIYGGRDSKVILEHYSVVLNALGEKDLSDYYRRLSEQE